MRPQSLVHLRKLFLEPSPPPAAKMISAIPGAVYWTPEEAPPLPLTPLPPSGLKGVFRVTSFNPFPKTPPYLVTIVCLNTPQ